MPQGANSDPQRALDLENALKLRSQVLESMSEGVSLTDEVGTILYTNAAEDLMFGYAPGELIGMHVSVQNAYPEQENLAKVSAVIEELKQSGRWSGEWHNRKKDGTIFFTRAQITRIEIEGRPHFVCVQEDITEREKAQQALEESEKTLEQIFSESPSFMTFLSVPDYRYIKSNEEHYRLIGQRDILGKSVQEVMPELEAQGFIKLLDDVVSSGRPYVGTEVPITFARGADGKPKPGYLDFVYQPLRRANGQVYGIAVQGYDVTEKVLSRKAVENERQNFRSLFKQTPEMVCILKGPRHVFEFVNEAHIRALGFDATGMAVREAQPESVEVHGLLDEVYRTGRTAELHEIPVTVTDRLRYFNLTYAARRDEAGNINGLMILGVEVTDQVLAREGLRSSEEQLSRALELQKTAQLALSESKERLQFAIETAELGAWDYDLPSGIVHWDDRTKQAWGASPDTGDTTLEAVLAGIHPDDRERVGELVRKSLDPNGSGRYSAEFRTISVSDGKIRWLSAKGMTFFDAERLRPLRLMGTVADVTERRQIEEALRKSEEGFRTMAEAIPQIVWTARPDGSVLYYNQRWVEFTGLSMEESTRRGMATVVHPDDLETVIERWRGATRTGEVFSAEYRLKRHDGTYRWFLGRSVPLRTGSGELAQWFGTATDIDENKRAQIAQRLLDQASLLLSSSLDYRATLQSVADLAVADLADWCGVDILSDKGELQPLAVAHRDPSMVELAREVRRRYPVDIDAPSGSAAVVRTGTPEIYPVISDDLLVQAAKDPEHLELMRKLNLHSLITVPLLADGRAFGTVTLAISGTERRFGPDDLATAQELARRAALAIQNAKLFSELNEALQARDEFLSIASHELRTPLTPIKLQLQSLDLMIRRGNPEGIPAAQVKKVVDVSLRQITKLSALFEDLLDVARINAGRLSLNLEQQDLVELVEETIERYSAQGAASGTSFRLTAPGSAVASVDRLRIEQVIINLLTNAMKFAPGTSVDVAVSTAGEKIRISVRDKGIGIAKEDLARIFNRFERIQSSNNVGGLGLGLYISRQIVESHGGRIWAESAAGEGTTFAFEVPVGGGSKLPHPGVDSA